MKYNVICPICGKLLSKSGNGTNSEQKCPKCKSELLVEVTDSHVTVEVLKMSTKQKCKRPA